MTRTPSAPALLHVAVQDLAAGKRLLAERLPALAAAARAVGLVALLRTEAARAQEQGERLARQGGAGGPENLWMAGILDDADRDARSHQPGRLLDIALVGAVRKAKAAEIVSSETALALAAVSDAQALHAAIAANRDEEIAADRALRALLTELAGTAG